MTTTFAGNVAGRGKESTPEVTVLSAEDAERFLHGPKMILSGMNFGTRPIITLTGIVRKDSNMLPMQKAFVIIGLTGVCWAVVMMIASFLVR